jgi:RNA ligase (TIGR02306 family)
MAFFGVTVEEIETVNPIEGADRIQVATVKGLVFNFVIGKDSFKPGDKVLYFPIDSLLPQALAEKLGVAGKLAGKNKDRVKTVKLRGVMSQGIVGPFSLLEPWLIQNYGSNWSEKGIEIQPSAITEWFGVTKYEPPEVVCQGGKLVRHVEGVSTYDIEGADRYPVVVNELMNQQVYITEKVEGSNWYGGIDAAGNFVVGQRSGAIIPDDASTHTWWSVAVMQGLLDAAAAIQREKFPGKSVIIRGEIAGGNIQGNIYKLPKMQIFAFDILVDGAYLDALTFLDLTVQYKIQTAPMLSISKTLHEWLGGKTVKDASHGKSLLGDTIREGIVIKPIVEQYSKVLGGRLFIKQRDPIYLDKTGN